MSIESYKHNFAKNLLAKWLRESAAEAHARGCNDDYVSIDCAGLDRPQSVCEGALITREPSAIRWRVNRCAPHYGVWMEYPIAGALGTDPVWDERDPKHSDRPPTYEECLAEHGRAPGAIFDIAIQHKGRVVIAIEVVNKHRVSAVKAARTLHNGEISLYATTADWVLGQVGRPAVLRMVEIVGSAAGVA